MAAAKSNDWTTVVQAANLILSLRGQTGGLSRSLPSDKIGKPYLMVALEQTRVMDTSKTYAGAN